MGREYKTHGRDEKYVKESLVGKPERERIL
jgi:hypothetical protein